jgi:DNA modification methylase
MSVTILQGDCRSVLATLPDESVHCCVTSPPYFGLRDYGVAGQIGLESTPDAFVAELVAVFREVRRVLRSDGTAWLNLGDSYAGGGNYRGINSEETLSAKQRSNGGARGVSQLLGAKNTPGCKPKDLIGVPWAVAFALRADGWYLRQDIIWSKPNPMPESVRDRCTKAHEYLFLLSKSASYYYDADAIAEPCNYPDGSWGRSKCYDGDSTGKLRSFYGKGAQWKGGETRNRRSVWEVATQPFAEAHFATFPPALIEPCILAGCPERCCAKCGAPWVREVERTPMVLARSERTHERGQTRSSGTMLEPPKSITLGFSPSCSCNAGTVPGTCLDPFGGAGTTGLVADRLKRNAMLIELNPEYAHMAMRRISDDAPMFSSVTLSPHPQPTEGERAERECRAQPRSSPSHDKAGAAHEEIDKSAANLISANLTEL